MTRARTGLDLDGQRHARRQIDQAVLHHHLRAVEQDAGGIEYSWRLGSTVIALGAVPGLVGGPVAGNRVVRHGHHLAPQAIRSG
jgi:hypothetical protein